MTKINAKGIAAAVLCGGRGKRISSVITDRPKPMAQINGHPFLDFVLDYLLSSGIEQIVLCLGHKAGFIKEYYKGNSFLKNHILFSEENKPLGTAGALKNCQGKIKSETFVSVNGDSLCEVDLSELLDFHARKKALASIALSVADNRDDVGSVRLNKNNRIIGFYEKNAKVGGSIDLLVNAGVYVFSQEIFSLIPEGKEYSLEYDLFPGLERCFGYLTDKHLIDIGNPKRYYKAQQVLQDKKIKFFPFESS